MDERVGSGRWQQPGEQRVADVGLEELGPLELGERRGRVEADHLLDAGIALETERELGSPMGSDAGDQETRIRRTSSSPRACSVPSTSTSSGPPKGWRPATVSFTPGRIPRSAR